jgi:hypothetical protein
VDLDLHVLGTDLRIPEKRNYHDQVHFRDDSTFKDSHSHAHVARHHHHDHDDAHVHVHRRSSLIVPGQNGQSYVVSPTRRAPVIQESTGSTDSQAYFESENRQDGVPGRVDVMVSPVCDLLFSLSTRDVHSQSPVANEQKAKKIACLCLDDDTFTFKASETNCTEMRMVSAPAAMASNSESGTRLVMLEVSVFNPSAAELMPYCATTNTQEGSTDLKAEHCRFSQGVDPTSNQLFDYNVDSGVVRPTQYAGHDDGRKDDIAGSSDANDAAMSAFGERDANGSNNAQPVALVFVPEAPEVANVKDATESSEETVVTSTMTRTFTLTSSMTTSVYEADVTPTSTMATTDSAISSALVSSASAADVSPTLATVSSSIPVVTVSSTMSAAAADVTSSTDSSSSSVVMSTATVSVAGASITSATVASSSTSATSITSESVPSLAELDVQVVAPSSSSSSAVSMTVTSTTPTSSVDADAIASRIAASAASSSSADVVSSTVMLTATAAAMDASSGASSSTVSSSIPTVTPVSTAPYMFMFRVRKE